MTRFLFFSSLLKCESEYVLLFSISGHAKEQGDRGRTVVKNEYQEYFLGVKTAGA